MECPLVLVECKCPLVLVEWNVRLTTVPFNFKYEFNYELDSYVMFCKLIIFISGFSTKVIAQVNKKLKQNKIKKIRKPQNGKMYNYSIFILNAPLSAII